MHTSSELVAASVARPTTTEPAAHAAVALGCMAVNTEGPASQSAATTALELVNMSCIPPALSPAGCIWPGQGVRGASCKQVSCGDESAHVC